MQISPEKKSSVPESSDFYPYQVPENTPVTPPTEEEEEEKSKEKDKAHQLTLEETVFKYFKSSDG